MTKFKILIFFAVLIIADHSAKAVESVNPLSPVIPKDLIGYIQNSIEQWHTIQNLKCNLEIIEQASNENGALLKGKSLAELYLKDYLLSEWRLNFSPKSFLYRDSSTGKLIFLTKNCSIAYNGEYGTEVTEEKQNDGNTSSRGRIFNLTESEKPTFFDFNPISYTFPHILAFAGLDPISLKTSFKQGTITAEASDKTGLVTVVIRNYSNCLQTTITFNPKTEIVDDFESNSFDPVKGTLGDDIKRKIVTTGGSNKAGSALSYFIPKKINMEFYVKGEPVRTLEISLQSMEELPSQSPDLYTVPFPGNTLVQDERLKLIFRASENPTDIFNQIKKWTDDNNK